MKRFLIAWCAAACLATCLVTPATAQTGPAAISGVVTDPTGAVVPQATVRVLNVKTGIERIVETNEAGLYLVEALPPGEYQVIVRVAGFKRSVRSGVVLEVDRTTVQDVSLEIGNVQEAVEVEATSAQFLKPASSELSEVITQKMTQELPLNGRNFQSLIALNAGVATGSPGTLHSSEGFAFNVNGLRESSNACLIEGVDNNYFTNQTPNTMLQVDAIAEFNILTNNFSAEYGRAAGGVINLVMRSGTNEFHGSIFEFLRNDILDATDFFTNKAGKEKNPFRFNQFGGTFAGPIVKKRTFFFSAYQGTRARSQNTSVVSVPPLAWRSGDFSGLLAEGVQIYDPTTVLGYTGPFPIRAPFEDNIIPLAQQDPAARALLQLFPAPNLPGDFNNYAATTRHEFNQDALDIKIDHSFTAKDLVTARYNLSDVDLYKGAVFGETGGGYGWGFVAPGRNFGSYAGPADERSQNFAASYSRILSPTTLNELRFNWARRNVDFSVHGFGENLNDLIGIPGLNLDENSSGLAWACFAGYDCLGGHPVFPIHQPTTTLQLIDNVSLVQGRHTMKFGVDYRYRILNLFQAVFPRGFFFFDRFATSQIGAGGNPIASTLMGFPVLIQRDVLDHTVKHRSWELAWFFQDNFRVTPRLTVNLGLRYDFFNPFVEAHDRQANFDPETVTMALAGRDDNSRSLVKADKNNLAPRVGFAYSLTGDQRTILRGGYGISYYSEANASGTLDRLAFNIPYYYLQTILQIGIFDPFRSLSDGVPAAIPPDPNSPFGTVKYRNPDLVDSYVQYWNLDVQRELFPNLILDVAYAGTRGVHLLALRNINQPLPGPVLQFPVSPIVGDVRTMESRANSIYHSLQVKVNKRWSDGLSFLGSWTWSKAIDNSVGYWGPESGSTYPQDSHNFGDAERGLSAFDRRHRFVFSYVWELPIGYGKHFLSEAQGIVNRLLGGWQMTGITTFSSGTPFTPIISVNQANTAFGGEQRPTRIGSGSLPDSERSVDRWFETNAFVLPELFTYGNSGRNILIGPGTVNFDWSLFKNIAIGEAARLQFRAELFNLFNTPHFGLPNRAVDLPQGGTITSLSAPPRQIQFGLKLDF